MYTDFDKMDEEEIARWYKDKLTRWRELEGLRTGSNRPRPHAG